MLPQKSLEFLELPRLIRIDYTIAMNQDHFNHGSYGKLAYIEIREAKKLRIQIAIRFQYPSCIFSAQFTIDWYIMAQTIFRHTCTGGAQPLVAMACAPVYPVLAT